MNLIRPSFAWPKLFIGILYLLPGGGAVAAQDQDWQSLVKLGYDTSAVVLAGTVSAEQNHTATDGGHVYTIDVDRVFKGEPESVVTVRAGGFAYGVSLAAGETALWFLQRLNSDPSGPYTLIEPEPLTPLLLVVKASALEPVNRGFPSVFSGLPAASIFDYLAGLPAHQ